MRAISRLVDCSINTVTRELVLAGQACADFPRPHGAERDGAARPMR